MRAKLKLASVSVTKNQIARDLLSNFLLEGRPIQFVRRKRKYLLRENERDHKNGRDGSPSRPRRARRSHPTRKFKSRFHRCGLGEGISCGRDCMSCNGVWFPPTSGKPRSSVI